MTAPAAPSVSLATPRADAPATQVIAIAMGDVAGIGPEILAKAFRDAPQRMRGCFVAGDVAAMRRAAQAVGGLLPVWVLDAPTDVLTVPEHCIPVWQACEPLAPANANACASATPPSNTADRAVSDTSAAWADLPAWGRVDARAGRAAAECIAWASRAALRREVAAVVTAPIHKEAFSAAGLSFPGHTEYLQALAAEYLGCPLADVPVRMLLANPELQTVLVTIHVGLRQAIEQVTTQAVLQTLRITHTSLARNGRRLRMAVAGLNPHAGEGGLFGREEIDIIQPAIEQARAQGLDVHGPFAPDTVFMRARKGEFDVVVAMYHDQGLIPVKYLGVEHGVNVTLGLPFVRTSPDHGTAFDLAGQGVADPSSLLAAVDWARAATAAVPQDNGQPAMDV